MDCAGTDAIRNALGSGEFDKAHRLFDEYADHLRDSILQGSVSEPELAEMRQLIDWARGVVLCFRSHAAERLRTAQAAEVYEGSPVSIAPTMQVRF